MTVAELEKLVEEIVRQVLSQNAEFSNVVPTEPPKASTATQGAWDSTNTPGGVSKFAKKAWTIKDMEEVEKNVRKALEKAEFFNNPTHPYPTKTSASSTQVITEHVPSKKLSASTQPSWKKEEEISNKVSASVIAQILTNVYKLDV